MMNTKSRIINQKILPIELLTIIENDELEWDGGAIISLIDYFENDAKIELCILLDRSDEKKQLWQIHIQGIRNENVVREWVEDIVVYDQHFLIDEQKDFYTELYIKNRPIDSHKLFHDLYTYFQKEFNGHLSFDKYLNYANNVDSLLKMDSGLFANGPKFILTQVDAILKNNGCDTYFFGEQKPNLWLNNQWIEDTAELITLSIGKSYFVAENITFKRIK